MLEVVKFEAKFEATAPQTSDLTATGAYMSNMIASVLFSIKSIKLFQMKEWNFGHVLRINERVRKQQSRKKQNFIWNELQVILKKFNVIYKTVSLFESRHYQSPLEAFLAENRTTFCNNLLYTGQQTLEQPICPFPADVLGFFLNPHLQ